MTPDCVDREFLAIRDTGLRFSLMLRLRVGVSVTCETAFSFRRVELSVCTCGAALREGDSLILDRGGVRVIRACLYVRLELLLSFLLGEVLFCVFVVVFIAEAILIHLRLIR